MRSSARLVIDLRTDLVPEREFTDVRVRFYEADAYSAGAAPFREHSVRADVGADYFVGVRIADEAGLAPGDYVIVGELLSAHFGGRAIAGTAVLLVLASDRSAMLVVPRVCLGARVALDGCEPPECATDGDCPPPVSDCAAARCVEEICLDAPVEGACELGFWCNPDVGCTVEPTVGDAGMVDAGTEVVDAAIDVDAGMVDAGPGGVDAGGADAGCTGECAPGATESRGCGRCGMELRTCRGDCTWGGFSGCGGEGECSAGAMESRGCGRCGSESRTCGGDCRWGGFGGCGGEGECSAGAMESRGCGRCGSESRTCGGDCRWGGFGGCGGEGECSPGATESRGCGNCGNQTRSCGGGCTWGGFGGCGGEGVCSPGAIQSGSCGTCSNGTHSRSCTSSCGWGSYGACTGQRFCTDALVGGSVCPGSTGNRDCPGSPGAWQRCTCSTAGTWVSCSTPCFL